MKKHKKLIISIVIICIILILISIMCILLNKNKLTINELEKKAKTMKDINNYSYIVNIISQNGNVEKSRYWIKDGAFSAKVFSYNEKGQEGICEVYEDKDNKIHLAKFKNGTTYYYINGETNSKSEMEFEPAKLYDEMIFFEIKDNVKYINEEKFLGKETYLIVTKDNNKYWIEMETGLIIGNTIGDTIVNYNFEIDNVTDEYMKIPDTESYK